MNDWKKQLEEAKTKLFPKARNKMVNVRDKKVLLRSKAYVKLHE